MPDRNEEPSVSSHAAEGGKARAKSLTPEERTAIARRAVEARWEKAGKSPIPRASHEGSLRIGNMDIQCYVLKNGTRVLSQGDFLESLGRHRKANVRNEGEERLPAILQGKAINPFIPHEIAEKSRPIRFQTTSGSVASGYLAELLPAVCEIYLKARDNNALPKNQEHVAKQAEILIRALATVGIIALVDEATGYQYERPIRDLEEQLSKFLAEGLVRYASGFPHEYLKHLCRLRGVELRPDMRLPQYFGHLTGDLVYKRIAPGLLRALKDRRAERGRQSNKLYQWTSQDTGYPALMLHLGTVVTLMKLHTNYNDFKKQLDQIAPRYPDVPGLFDKAEDWDAVPPVIERKG